MRGHMQQQQHDLLHTHTHSNTHSDQHAKKIRHNHNSSNYNYNFNNNNERQSSPDAAEVAAGGGVVAEAASSTSSSAAAEPEAEAQAVDLTAAPLDVYTQSTAAIRVNNKQFECATDIGLRPTQEDRVLLVPRLYVDDIGFCCVFDGTVGHHASDYLMSNMLDHLCNRPEMQELINKTLASSSADSADQHESMAIIIRNALHHAFLNVDASLIQMCSDNNLHYASSTGVAALLWRNLLTVAHVGDSKACIAKVDQDGTVRPEWLTIDHKPNMPHELKRIQANGGSLAWLHGNKPYIRGGDFVRRQANGEHPKQLNYSRAFGGKDLKMFGLIAEPDINHFEISEEDKVIIIASDGLWDVLSPKFACELALQAKGCGRSASEELVGRAIREMPNANICDNVTVIVIFLNEK